MKRAAPAVAADPSFMWSTVFRDEPPSAECARIEAWVRERFALCADDTVQVEERAGTLPGCPPLETVVSFWIDAADDPEAAPLRHHCKVFKAALDVVPDDLPPPWMKSALVVAPGFSCDCC
jgi:nitrate reductase delta subunit